MEDSENNTIDDVDIAEAQSAAQTVRWMCLMSIISVVAMGIVGGIEAWNKGVEARMRLELALRQYDQPQPAQKGAIDGDEQTGTSRIRAAAEALADGNCLTRVPGSAAGFVRAGTAKGVTTNE